MYYITPDETVGSYYGTMNFKVSSLGLNLLYYMISVI